MSHYNLEFLLESLTAPVVIDTASASAAVPRETAPRRALLPRSLPPSSYLHQLARTQAEATKRAYVLASSLDAAVASPLGSPTLPEPPDRPDEGAEPRATFASISRKLVGAKAPGKAGAGGAARVEQYMLFQAIDKKDLMFLMEVREAQFDLLVKPMGGVTPLVYAMRLGQTHREVAIVLTGIISKRVNTYSDVDPSALARTPGLLGTLRAIRANLKLAIAYGLATHQVELLASYLQVIVMSEGDRWVKTSAADVALALRAGGPAAPVRTARSLVEKWVGRELKEGEVAAVGEYTSNAAADLVIMGLWNVVADKLGLDDAIESWYFARDDRVLKSFEERLEPVRRSAGWTKLTKLTKRQVDTACEVLGRRQVGARERIERLAELLDEG